MTLMYHFWKIQFNPQHINLAVDQVQQNRINEGEKKQTNQEIIQNVM